MPAWEQAVFHLAKNRHVLAHINVIRGHVDHVFKTAAALLQYLPQVLPGGDELRLGVRYHGHFRRASDLACALQCVPTFYGSHVARAQNEGLNGGGDDAVAVGYRLYLLAALKSV